MYVSMSPAGTILSGEKSVIFIRIKRQKQENPIKIPDMVITRQIKLRQIKANHLEE